MRESYLSSRSQAAVLIGTLPTETAKNLIVELDLIEKEILVKKIMDLPVIKKDEMDTIISSFLSSLEKDTEMSLQEAIECDRNSVVVALKELLAN